LGHLADAADVLGAILGREPEVLVEAVTDVVAVQDVGAHAAFEEALLQVDGDRRLAGARQSREPDRTASVAVQALAILAGDRALVPHDVRRSLLCHAAGRFTGVRPHGQGRPATLASGYWTVMPRSRSPRGITACACGRLRISST